MNAAARLVHHHVLPRQLVLALLLTRQQMAIFLLALAVLFSALGTVYVTHVTREMQANYQHNLLEKDRLHVSHGQLLLERSAWMMQARIEQIAESKLGMMIPDHKSVVIIHE